MSTFPGNASMSELEQELATVIIEALRLPISTQEFVVDAPLFGGELGLDSIDVLEIALALSRKYGIEIRSDDAENPRIFASLRSLAGYVAAHRAD
ncbi:MAG: phosphopantetheine-binding protein [Betaproteobacteria bacterium]